jgi:hypothetical protein
MHIDGHDLPQQVESLILRPLKRVAAATAILDRFLQDAELIQITGKSYRLRSRVADTSQQPTPAEPANEPSKTGQTRTPGKTKKSTRKNGK